MMPLSFPANFVWRKSVTSRTTYEILPKMLNE